MTGTILDSVLHAAKVEKSHKGAGGRGMNVNVVRIQDGPSHWHDCPLGGTVIRETVKTIEVPEHCKVTIFQGANEGGGRFTVPFFAGKYSDVWLYGKWLHKLGPKFVRVEAIEMDSSQMLSFIWHEKARDGRLRRGLQKFTPGEYEAGNGDFKEDVFDSVFLPEDGTVQVFDARLQGTQKRRGKTEYKSSGKHNLADRALDHRISSFNFKHDDWEIIKHRLGDLLSRHEIGKPITVPFESSGLAGAVLHPSVELGRLKEAETHWDFIQRAGIEATVGTGESSPVKAELTVKSETEAGTGGADRNTLTEGSSITVDAAADAEGILKGFILAQLMEAAVRVFRTWQNKRTKATFDQPGEIVGPLYSYKVRFERGAAPS